jgi:hypothetical protein
VWPPRIIKCSNNSNNNDNNNDNDNENDIDNNNEYLRTGHRAILDKGARCTSACTQAMKQPTTQESFD